MSSKTSHEAVLKLTLAFHLCVHSAETGHVGHEPAILVVLVAPQSSEPGNCSLEES